MFAASESIEGTFYPKFLIFENNAESSTKGAGKIDDKDLKRKRTKKSINHQVLSAKH